MRHTTSRVLAGCAAALLTGCAGWSPRAFQPSLPHFFKVDERLYRGAQPTDEGFRELARLGVKTIVDLRVEDADGRRDEQRLVESLGMRWVHLPMRMYWRPSDEQAMAFLQLFQEAEGQPVFIHCRAGEDRTGAMVALYRIVERHWNPEAAYAEARTLGMTGWNPFMRYTILHDAQAEYAPGLASLASAPLLE